MRRASRAALDAARRHPRGDRARCRERVASSRGASASAPASNPAARGTAADPASRAPPAAAALTPEARVRAGAPIDFAQAAELVFEPRERRRLGWDWHAWHFLVALAPAAGVAAWVERLKTSGEAEALLRMGDGAPPRNVNGGGGGGRSGGDERADDSEKDSAKRANLSAAATSPTHAPDLADLARRLRAVEEALSGEGPGGFGGAAASGTRNAREPKSSEDATGGEAAAAEEGGEGEEAAAAARARGDGRGGAARSRGSSAGRTGRRRSAWTSVEGSAPARRRRGASRIPGERRRRRRRGHPFRRATAETNDGLHEMITYTSKLPQIF